MSPRPRHRRRPQRARRYVVAPVTAVTLAGVVAVPSLLPGGGGDGLVVRMDDARKAATAAGKAAAGLPPATVDRNNTRTSGPVPTPVSDGSSPQSQSPDSPTLTRGAPRETAGRFTAKATTPPVETPPAAAPVEAPPSPAAPPEPEKPQAESPSESKTPSRTTTTAEREPAVTHTPEDRPSTTQPSRPQSSSAEESAEAEVLDIVNAERAAVGCGPVAGDSGLADLAGDYSADMAERGFFSHTDPDGRDPWDRAEAAGIDYLRAENIARGQDTSSDVMSSWMDSSGHRANILNCKYTKLGVGVYFGSGGPWWTQEFGV